ncbi:MoxR-like ATPase [Pontibacter aydingkolensis]|uniref:MoxR family ATPase n=1 Tax=Pontibacter aydingkolensis TaxID=1911536 RepID=A0ABS7CSL0_9BACT|nr:MoxR family ATPase [Pontibacter aydingkolensis]MBW7466839.1 MoxR family ATPase [Pontibacter aydingkolensis]
MLQPTALQDYTLKEKVQLDSYVLKELVQELEKNIVGQRRMIDRLIIALLGGGHILLEGVPGLAKTLAAKALATSISGSFQRIQFTPDLLPSDITGTTIFNLETHEFIPKKGPVFTNFLLADEINRAPEKVQSALLEAMQEKQVTIGDYTYKIEGPFMVLATQNPIEQHGTYTLPEAQLDRFMLKIIVNYPSFEEERLIMQLNQKPALPAIEPVLHLDQIISLRTTVNEIYIDSTIESYILKIIFATRSPEKYQLPQLQKLIRSGASPRGTVNMATAAKAKALLEHRDYVIPEDVKDVCLDVLRHRISVSYLAESENITSDILLKEILEHIDVP